MEGQRCDRLGSARALARAVVRGLGLGLASTLLAAAPHVAAAPPQVPATLSYQGVLLAPGGQPQAGPVDLTIRIFDAAAAGTLLYKQGFPAVPLADGAFHVVLGPTGDAGDPPFAAPLTTSLADALAADLGALGPDRFVQVTVGSDGAIGRTQVLATSYALRAVHAASADSAALADVANTALDAFQVGGVSSAFVTELWEHFDADGGAPPNTDPLEGTGDVDGDGIANFVDPDNDGDTISDADEVANGTGVNVLTPRVTSVTPRNGFAATTSVVTVNGAAFAPGLAVQLGSQALAPADLTSTSFTLTVGPQPAGAQDLTATLPNGELGTLANAFTFAADTLTHTVVLGFLHASVHVRPGTQELALAGAGEYGVGSALQQEEPLATNGAGGQIAVAWDGDVLTGVRCRNLSATSCVLEYLRDGDGDRQLEDETGTPIETLSSAVVTPMATAVALLYDPAGRPVVGYVKRVAPASAMLARDLDDDGDFDGAGERVTLEANIGAGSTPAAAALALDSAGRIAYAYHVNLVGVRVKWDRNGDGDFDDTIGGNAETFSIPTPSGGPGCLGAAFDSSDRLAIVFGDQFALQGRILRDVSADGDFLDAGENVMLPGASGLTCDVAGRPGQPLVAVNTESNLVRLWIDRNDDGAFDQASESLTFGPVTTPSLGVVVTEHDTILVAAQNRLFFAETGL